MRKPQDSTQRRDPWSWGRDRPHAALGCATALCQVLQLPSPSTRYVITVPRWLPVYQSRDWEMLTGKMKSSYQRRVCCTTAVASPAPTSLCTQHPTDGTHTKHGRWCLLSRLPLRPVSLHLPHLLISSQQRAAMELLQPEGSLAGHSPGHRQSKRLQETHREIVFPLTKFPSHPWCPTGHESPSSPLRRHCSTRSTHTHTCTQNTWAALRAFGPLTHTLTPYEHQNSLSPSVNGLLLSLTPFWL